MFWGSKGFLINLPALLNGRWPKTEQLYVNIEGVSCLFLAGFLYFHPLWVWVKHPKSSWESCEAAALLGNP